MNYRVPFNKPFIVGKELQYISASVQSGHSAGDGIFSRKCRELMESRFDTGRILLTPSCTAALEMSAILADMEKGEEVILPSFTFVSTANAFLLHGATPRFVDIRPDTLNLDERLIGEAVSERARAIVPVHYAGVACEMDTIRRIADKHRLLVFEDAAQAVNSRYKGKYLGTLSDLGSYSFHETKNFACGEGGALVINNEQFLERAEIIREKGTDRTKFFRGEIDKYTWVDKGSSYLPSDIQAAFLFAQLENMDLITAKRKHIYNLYREELAPLANRGLLTLPHIPRECDSNYHLFHILLEDRSTRTALIDHLHNKGIQAVFHYVPLHTSPMGCKMGYREGMLPVTENVSARLLRLPFYFELSDQEIGMVVSEVKNFYGVP